MNAHTADATAITAYARPYPATTATEGTVRPCHNRPPRPGRPGRRRPPGTG
ncbi:hypothetical protein SCATT_p05190 (plasmid) [Streptantibioticus cattleyicolor NRRL 8057 = DSM 46488]|uniref:Uncharacterized protein n=1 Tax=Streptantibioticus cattleyicolor (strain ATCC 35852 / DSM 46488 / JCM 4925 / NBRC 14057 / NRRL 8057) TaxID=1003195 RepID=G8XGF4_STREN|nr:hypothetical protein SCATT_p05190 [Streptantibioticus cattleyicolor NRRL 8057 = DSM 46488]